MATLAQIHHNTRVVIRARIDRGVMSVSLLSRAAAISQPHVTNFIQGKRNLSVAALSRVLVALKIDLDVSKRQS